jgi:transcription elongation GreA/GreB family factor
VSEPNAAARARLEEERARLQTERRRLAADLGGEDPRDPDVGDRGDQAQILEGADDLARIDQRLREIDHLIAELDETQPQDGLVDGTLVTLRFPDGDVTTLRVAAVAEEAGPDEVVTADSPLGHALAGHRPGDTVSYQGPDGELQAQLVDLRPPNG